MAEKLEEVEITAKDIAAYLDSADSRVLASKLRELTTNVNTLIERIQDLISEDQMLSAAGAVSFTAALTVAGEAQISVMIGTNKDVIIGLHVLSEQFKKLYMSEEDLAAMEKLKRKD